MSRVYIDEECKMCTSYGKWISSKNLNIDLNAQINLTPEEIELDTLVYEKDGSCLLYTSPSPRDVHLSRMPSSA